MDENNALAAAIVALVNKISDAVGATFKPVQIKRVNKAENEAKIRSAEADAEVAVIQAQTDIEIADLRRRAEMISTDQEESKSENISTEADAEVAAIQAQTDIEIVDLRRAAEMRSAEQEESKSENISTEADAEVAAIQAQTDIEIVDLRCRAEMRSAEQEVIHQSNMESIIAKVLPNLNTDASPEGMENDWVANFFEKCKIVSDEQMQEVWARILIGEANNPGSFSRKTVNLMADLGKGDAELFRTLCRFAWSSEGITMPITLIFDYQHEIYNQEGITYPSCSYLESLGLVTKETYGFRLKGNQVKLSYFTKSITVRATHNSPNKGDINAGLLFLTNAGAELAGICDVKPVDGFFDYVCNQLSQGYQVTLE